MSNRVLTDVMNKNNFDAGTKARNDVASILSGLGYSQTIIFNRTHSSLQRMIEVLLALTKLKFAKNKNEIIVIQYPYQLSVMQMILKSLSKLRSKKNCKVVILIHDVVYLRQESYITKDRDFMTNREIEIFNKADAVISHTPVMTAALKNSGLKTKVIELGPFDYLYQGVMAQNVYDINNIKIAFAGNLSEEKSSFIYKCLPPDGITFNLYGSKVGIVSKGFEYKGSFPPDDLIPNLAANYGLVWDGPSTNGCTGNYGNYLRYNCPHKFSLYIAAGIPVIIWKESALADYVQTKHLGICVDSLEHLAELLKNIDVNRYQEMQKSVFKERKEIINGEHLKEALNRI